MKKSDRLFSKLLTETEAVFGVPRKGIPVSRGTKKRWRDIVLFWGKHSDIGELAFYSALYHIACGETPAGPYLDGLGTCIKDIILNVPEAVEVWRTTDAFRGAYACVVDDIMRSCCRSFAIKKFLCDRLMVRTFYRKDEKLPNSLALVEWRQLARARKVARVRHAFYQFMETVKIMVPSSVSWPEDYFANPSCIYAALAYHHGLPCSYWEAIFDDLIRMIQHKLDGQSYYRELFDVGMQIPDSLAHLIWPQEMEKEICWQFLLLARRDPSDPEHRLQALAWDDPQMIAQTWAFQKMCSWRESRSYPMSDKVRSAILQYATGIHPATIKSKSA